MSGLPQATVLIGANGSGKSNFMRFFEMLSWMLKSRRLQEYVQRQGGADDQLFGGSRRNDAVHGSRNSNADFTGPARLPVHAWRTRTLIGFLFTDERFRYSTSWFWNRGGLAASWKRTP